MTGLAENKPHVRAENGMAIICVPRDEIHGLLVALAPCPCRNTKSQETVAVRERLSKALTWARERL
jgi:hypothetical protein